MMDIIEGKRIPSQKYVPIKTANENLTLLKENLRENVLSSNYGLINVEFRFPLMKGFKGVLFYDLGAVHLKSKNQSVFDYGHSAGIGFRYQTFLIPVGMDIAYRLPPRESYGEKDSNYRIHFSIGW